MVESTKQITYRFKNYIFFAIIAVLTIILSWKYIRRLYYISLLPGPRAYPLIGNVLLLAGSLEEVSNTFITKLCKYAPIFRFWLSLHPIVIISKPEYIQKVLTNSHGMEKAWLMRYISGTVFGDPILISLVPKWKRNRKIVKSGLGQGIINSFLPAFIKQSNILVEVLRPELEKDKQSFDAFRYLSRTTLDTVCDAVMGVDMNSQRTDSVYINALDSELEIMVERAYKVWLHPPIFFNMSAMAKKHKENIDTIWGITDQIIAEKRKVRESNTKFENVDINVGLQKNPLRKPLLDFLLDFMNVDEHFTYDQLREEINIVIFGAYETTARTLSYALMALGARKDIQQRVYDEVHSVFGNSNRPIELADFQNLVYMDMVIKETMRFFPTIPYIVREITGDIQLGKYNIPEDTTCLIAMMYLNYDENIWTNPKQFDPERFLPENSKNRHPYAYIPFSGGPRDCIGLKYAMMFMKTVLSTIVRNYEIHTDLDLNNLRYRLELSLKCVGGNLIKISPRK